jgi:hypothetical protein
MKPCCSLINDFGFRRFDPGNKKAPTHDEKGRQNGCALLIFPKLMMLELELAPVIETKVQSVAVVSSGQSLDHSS